MPESAQPSDAPETASESPETASESPEATLVPEPAPDAAEDAAEPEARAKRGCLSGYRMRGRVTIVKDDPKCDCSMDLADMSVNHAKDLVQLMHALTVNAR